MGLVVSPLQLVTFLPSAPGSADIRMARRTAHPQTSGRLQPTRARPPSAPADIWTPPAHSRSTAERTRRHLDAARRPPRSRRHLDTARRPPPSGRHLRSRRHLDSTLTPLPTRRHLDHRRRPLHHRQQIHAQGLSAAPAGVMRCSCKTSPRNHTHILVRYYSSVQYKVHRHITRRHRFPSASPARHIGSATQHHRVQRARAVGR
jgi:hypothetical protein